MSVLHITVAIATLADRLKNLSLPMLPETHGVDYHVFVQDVANPMDITGALERPDITLTALEGRGVAKSRNAAIEMAKGDIIIFADDDLILHTQNYDALRDLFRNTPELAFVCGQLRDGSGKPFKAYSPDGTPTSRLNTAKVGTPEMAVRTETIRAEQIFFDPNFGAGSQNWLGDEYIFLCDALRAGLRGQYSALSLATHSAPSSGQVSSSESFLVREAVFRRALGAFSWPFRCAFAWRHRNRFPDWGSFWRFVRF
jgi:glycosyltransferase involved in cell wall biosynthesis